MNQTYLPCLQISTRVGARGSGSPFTVYWLHDHELRTSLPSTSVPLSVKGRQKLYNQSSSWQVWYLAIVNTLPRQATNHPSMEEELDLQNFNLAQYLGLYK